MLSAKIFNEKEIYEICQRSAGISVDDRFKGALFFSAQQEDEYLSQTAVMCIGKIYNTERIFRTEDKLCYFGVSVGWGAKDSYLVSLNKKFCLKFDEPMDIKELKAYLENPPVPHGFVSHMSFASKISLIKKVLSVLETTE